MNVQLGTRFGPYEIRGVLGAGGMGEVYRGLDPRIGREVAVKVLPPELAADAERITRFELEARAAGALNHPNIVTLYDVGSESGVPYLVTEVLEGETLRQIIARGPLPPADAKSIIIQVAHGLAAAHTRGIVHRDLKPENVFVLPDGRAKILDFGIAKLTREEAPGTAETTPVLGTPTHAGTIVGTVSYMAPEQLRGRPVDQRTDLFALGTLFQELLTGEPAFPGETVADRMAAILSKTPEPLPAAVEAALPGLGMLIRRCLEKRPENRFESAKDLAWALDALEDAARTRGPAASPPEELQIRQLSFREGAISTARFAPDGRTVVYRASWEGGPWQMYLTRTDNLDYQPLRLGTAQLFAVSANAELAIGLDPRDQGGFVWLHTLARVSMLGGTPRELARDVYMADWSPDGRSIAAIREEKGRFRIEYPVGQVIYETTHWMSQIRVSPDDRRLAFFEHPFGGDNGGDLVVFERGAGPRVLVRNLTTATALAWHSPSELWFSAIVPGRTEGMIWAASLEGRLRKVHQTLGWPDIQDRSRQGQALVMQLRPRLRMQAGTRGSNERIELSWLDWSLTRDLSPDGTLALFDETGPGNPYGCSIFVRSVRGEPAVRITEGFAHAFMPGGELLTSDADRTKLYLNPLGVGEQTVIDTGGLRVHYARPFPDGRSLIAIANPPGETPRLYRIRVPEGTYEVFSPYPVAMACPYPSPSGDRVVMLQADLSLAVFPLDGSEPRPVPGIRSDERVCAWAPDGSAIFVFQKGKISGRVDRIALETGAREEWMHIEPMTRSGAGGFVHIRLSEDCERYVASFAQFVNDLFLVDGLR